MVFYENFTNNMKTIKYIIMQAVTVLILPAPLLADTIEDGRYWFALATQGKLPVENWSWNIDIN